MMAVRADHGLSLSRGQQALGIRAQRADLRALARPRRAEEPAAPPRHTLREGHGPIRMQQPEQTHRTAPAGEPLVRVIPPVLRVDAIAVGQVHAAAVNVQSHRVAVYRKSNPLLEKGTRPEIVVAAYEMKVDSCLTQVREGAQHIKIAGKYGVPVFEPKIKQVAEHHDARHVLRLQLA